MRILHTSDWHLGRSFHGAQLLSHQADYVDHLLAVVESERVDLVVVAGDVYDRALPPVDAVALADETLARLAASRARVVLTSGNHDSAQRLGFGARLADAAGVHVRASLAGVGTPVELADEHGPVLVHGLPYLEPQTAAAAWGLPGRSHEAVLTAAVRRVRADLATRPAGSRSVVLAHAFVAGATPSDSERDISVGGVDRVSRPVFDGPGSPLDYVALGHLHSPHELSARLRYSGSPLAYSFSEAGRPKGSWLVDLGAAGHEPGQAAVSATFVPAPVPRALARLRGSLDHLLHDPALAEHESAWVEATVVLAAGEPRPDQVMERVRRRFPHALVLAFERVGGEVGADTWAPPAAGRSDRDLVGDFVAQVRGFAADDDEEALLGAAVDACCHDPDLRPELDLAAAGREGAS